MQPSLPPPDFIDIPAIERYGRPPDAGLAAPPDTPPPAPPDIQQQVNFPMPFGRRFEGRGYELGDVAPYTAWTSDTGEGQPARITLDRSFVAAHPDAVPQLLEHEALHAANLEMPEYRQDWQAGYPGLRSAFATDRSSLAADPALNVNWAQWGRYGVPDYLHLWMTLADAYLRSPYSLPPHIRVYFDELTGGRPVPVRGPR